MKQYVINVSAIQRQNTIMDNYVREHRSFSGTVNNFAASNWKTDMITKGRLGGRILDTINKEMRSNFE